jgi:hypothetical protein
VESQSSQNLIAGDDVVVQEYLEDEHKKSYASFFVAVGGKILDEKVL